MFFPHVTVAAVVERDGRFLMVEENIGGRLVINQPAGHLEDDESLIAAVKREVQEETAWEVEPTGLIQVYRWRQAERDRTWLRFCFSAQTLRETNEPLDPDIERAVWMSEAEILGASERHRSPQVAAAVRDYLNGQRFPLDLLQDII